MLELLKRTYGDNSVILVEFAADGRPTLYVNGNLQILIDGDVYDAVSAECDRESITIIDSQFNKLHNFN